MGPVATELAKSVQVSISASPTPGETTSKVTATAATTTTMSTDLRNAAQLLCAQLASTPADEQPQYASFYYIIVRRTLLLNPPLALAIRIRPCGSRFLARAGRAAVLRVAHVLPDPTCMFKIQL